MYLPIYEGLDLIFIYDFYLTLKNSSTLLRSAMVEGYGHPRVSGVTAWEIDFLV